VIPELRTVIGQEVASELLVSDEAGMHQALKNCFRSLMTCPKETVQTQLQALQKRLASLGMPHCGTSHAHIVSVHIQEIMGLVFAHRFNIPDQTFSWFSLVSTHNSGYSLNLCHNHFIQILSGSVFTNHPAIQHCIL
jgi:hypothetical protein